MGWRPLNSQGPSALPHPLGEAEHQGTTFTQRTDHDLKTAVIDEIAWLPSVNSDHIGVAVTGGVVTLSGRVDSYPERYRAEQAALGVRGVTAVAEEITVQGTPESSDTSIAREANHALAQAIDVPTGSVQVLVKNSVLTLNGSIPWQFQRLAAARAVRYIKGVHGIHNNVSVIPTVSPQGIKDAISGALMRDALLEGHNITVSTDGGHVTLTGKVHTFAERRQAESTAWSAPGVSKVSCNLVVGA